MRTWPGLWRSSRRVRTPWADGTYSFPSPPRGSAAQLPWLPRRSLPHPRSVCGRRVIASVASDGIVSAIIVVAGTCIFANNSYNTHRHYCCNGRYHILDDPIVMCLKKVGPEKIRLAKKSNIARFYYVSMMMGRTIGFRSMTSDRYSCILSLMPFLTAVHSACVMTS